MDSSLKNEGIRFSYFHPSFPRKKLRAFPTDWTKWNTGWPLPVSFACRPDRTWIPRSKANRIHLFSAAVSSYQKKFQIFKRIRPSEFSYFEYFDPNSNIISNCLHQPNESSDSYKNRKMRTSRKSEHK